MSAIYFHSPSDTLRVSGRERAHMGLFCDDLLRFSLGLASRHFYKEEEQLFRKIIPIGHYLHQSTTFRDSLSIAVGSSASFGGSPLMYYDGTDLKTISLFEVALNTALSLGSDPAKLFARLHGQCEVHLYVESPNRPWLADIIEQGLNFGLYRKEMGWEEVIAFLRNGTDEPVVTSYSVCDQFPNPNHIWKQDKPQEEREQESDAWYYLSSEEKWSTALAALRENSEDLEIGPHQWAYPEFHFSTGAGAITGYHILEGAVQCNKERNVPS